MKLLNQILACLVTGLMLLVVVEGGLRLIGFGPAPTMNQFDGALGWTKTRDASIRRQTGEFDVTLETNSRGLREPESVGYAKSADAKRVLVIGDSFTLGYTVDRPDTISGLLGARLVAEGRNVEVLNGGTEGYSTDQEVLWLAREGARYAPDVVVLQMYENDIFWNGQDSYLRYPKPRFPVSADGVPGTLVPLVDPGLRSWWVRNTALGNLLSKTFSSQTVPMLDGPRPLPAEWGVRLSADAQGWPETAAALRAFVTVAANIGAEPLVLVVPDKAQIDPVARGGMQQIISDPVYDPERPFLGMVQRAEQAGLEVVDPRTALLAASKSGAEAVYFERDWHTNALGNRALAGELADALASPRLLGAPPRAAGDWAPVIDSGAGGGGLGRALLIAAGIWLVLGTLFLRRFPDQGAVGSYGPVAALIGFVLVFIYSVDWLAGFLPVWLQRFVPGIVVGAILGASIWYLRKRLGVMAELFGTFVRRGQWYVLPVLAGLLSLGALLVVAASSPWLAPFIYTLF
ncbi:MAG: SGNH/GDSL hydrolase family protein [Candidatus Binatia bacterium]|nr:SGNH/GDSL hydrolase family protein [Candidatus Binatia bacterium]